MLSLFFSFLLSFYLNRSHTGKTVNISSVSLGNIKKLLQRLYLQVSGESPPHQARHHARHTDRASQPLKGGAIQDLSSYWPVMHSHTCILNPGVFCFVFPGGLGQRLSSEASLSGGMRKKGKSKNTFSYS